MHTDRAFWNLLALPARDLSQGAAAAGRRESPSRDESLSQWECPGADLMFPGGAAKRAAQSEVIPSRIAYLVSSAIVCRPSLRMMFRRCTSTVLTDIWSCSPIA